VTAREDAPMFFMSVVGIPSFPVKVSSTSEAPSIDMVLILDRSESMGELRLNADGSFTNIHGSPNTDPYNCNSSYPPESGVGAIPAGSGPGNSWTGNCHPYQEAKVAAYSFVNNFLDPAYDRVAIISFDNTADTVDNAVNFNSYDPCDPSGSPAPQYFSSDLTAIKTSIKGLWIYDGQYAHGCPSGLVIGVRLPDHYFHYDSGGVKVFDKSAECPYDESNGDKSIVSRCRKYNLPAKTTYYGIDCPGYYDPPDTSTCGTTNIGGALRLASYLLSNFGRQQSLKVTILMTDGAANAGYYPDTVPPLPICPVDESNWVVSNTCRDRDATVRHSVGDPLYDTDDYARDQADLLVDQTGSLVYAIGLGDKLTNDPFALPGTPPAGASLLNYIAIKSNTAISDDPNPYVPKYYQANPQDLNAVFQDIANRINTLTTYTISGALGVNGTGASVAFTGGTPVTADGSGNYSFTVPYNWTGTITPSKTGYTFSPLSITITAPVTADLPNQDFTTLAPEIAVSLGGATNIPDGTGVVDFGSTTVGTPITRTFVIDNLGTADLTLSEPISLPAGFSLVSSFGSLTIAPGGNTSFQVRMDAATVSAPGGILSFANNDSDENPFNFAISGSVTEIPMVYLVDFNGDHKTDVAVFRPSNSIWYISGQGSFVYGQAGDIPVPADYDGDGKADIAIFRASNSTWYIRGQGSFVYGQSGDVPVVTDYNGDGKADIAVFRPSNSTWYVRGQGSFVYGQTGDIPVVADYNGDKKADIAVFRPTNSTWYLYGIGPRVYGAVGDTPVVADYNGDGKADIAVFRPTNSTWYLYGIGPRVYGTVGDTPVVGDYDGDGKADIAVFRPTNSTWYIYGIGPSVYGTVGDIPV
jgi:hypothetical protein